MKLVQRSEGIGRISFVADDPDAGRTPAFWRNISVDCGDITDNFVALDNSCVAAGAARGADAAKRSKMITPNGVVVRQFRRTKLRINKSVEWLLRADD